MSDFGISSTISTWGDVLTDYYGTKYDKQENEIAYQRALQNRDYMNQYNSPMAQMKRFKDAGLNPNLIYSQGSPGNQTQQQTYNPTKARTSKKNINVDVAGTVLALQEKKAIVDAWKAKTEGQKIKNEQAREGGLDYNYRWQKLNNQNRLADNITQIGKNLGIEEQIKKAELSVSEFRKRLADENINPNTQAKLVKTYELWQDTLYPWLKEKKDAWSNYDKNPKTKEEEFEKIRIFPDSWYED